MPKLITNGISIDVKTSYQPEYSRPALLHFIFSYKICIENKTENNVQLLKRHWHIFDSSGFKSEVKGEGVVGLQPVIISGESFCYESGCNLKSDWGKMFGTYLFLNLFTNQEFEVVIPSFELIANYKLN